VEESYKTSKGTVRENCNEALDVEVLGEIPDLLRSDLNQNIIIICRRKGLMTFICPSFAVSIFPSSRYPDRPGRCDRIRSLRSSREMFSGEIRRAHATLAETRGRDRLDLPVTAGTHTREVVWASPPS
jgi:hypothetical protein